MNKFIGGISVIIAGAVIGIAVLGCSPAGDNAADKNPTQLGSQLQYSEMVTNFVKNSSTFKFDGLAGSINVTNSAATENGSQELTVEYQTGQPGHSDRTGQMLAQTVTNHTAVIDVKDGQIVSAFCDGTFNMTE